MGGVLSIVLGIVTNLPQLVGIVVDIVKLINGFHPSARSETMSDLREAYRHAVCNRDDSKLSDVHSKLCAWGNRK